MAIWSRPGRPAGRLQRPPPLLLAVWIAAFPMATGLGQEPQRPLDPPILVRAMQLAPGLDYRHLSSGGSGGTEPLSVHVLVVDLARIGVKPVLALDQVLGQEAPTHMVSRFGALAGINGGFSISNDPYNPIHGDPNGFLVQEGEVVSDPVEPRASLGFCRDPGGEDEMRIVRPSVSHWALGEGDSVSVQGLNRARGEDDLVAYTPRWGHSTIMGPDGVEAVVGAGVVRQVVDGGSSPIPGDGFVLSASGSRIQELRVMEAGDSLRLKTVVTDLDRPGRRMELEGCSFTSAGPRIVHQGEAINDYSLEAFGDHFTLVRHPRTGVGRDGRGRLLVVVVDGRQPELSGGMTLPELAGLFIELGAVEAYNLDGGGSSIMVVGDRIMNSPSDGRERRRSDGILFLAREPVAR